MTTHKKRLILVHGDKGGVGKSTLAGLAIDYAITRYGQVAVAWMLGPDDSSAALSAESALCKMADTKVAVINCRFGDGKRFSWTRHPARTAWLESGGVESSLPALTDRAITAVQSNSGRYSDLAAPGSSLSTITRKYVGEWVRLAHEGPVALLFQDVGE